MNQPNQQINPNSSKGRNQARKSNVGKPSYTRNPNRAPQHQHMRHIPPVYQGPQTIYPKATQDPNPRFNLGHNDARMPHAYQKPRAPVQSGRGQPTAQDYLLDTLNNHQLAQENKQVPTGQAYDYRFRSKDRLQRPGTSKVPHRELKYNRPYEQNESQNIYQSIQYSQKQSSSSNSSNKGRILNAPYLTYQTYNYYNGINELREPQLDNHIHQYAKLSKTKQKKSVRKRRHTNFMNKFNKAKDKNKKFAKKYKDVNLFDQRYFRYICRQLQINWIDGIVDFRPGIRSKLNQGRMFYINSKNHTPKNLRLNNAFLRPRQEQPQIQQTVTLKVTPYSFENPYAQGFDEISLDSDTSSDKQ